MKVTARKEPNEIGLARVCQSPRGFIIKLDGKDVGRVGYARRLGEPDKTKPWFWYANVGEQAHNTSRDGHFWRTPEEARDSCIAWVKLAAKTRADNMCPTEKTK